MLGGLLLGLVVMQTVPAQDVPGQAVRQDPDGTQRWSVLADSCPRPDDTNVVIVCGQPAEPSPRLPLPAERGPPDHPAPSNPDLSGTGALAVSAAPCATRSQGCTTGIDLLGGGTFLIRAAGKLVNPDSCCEEPGEATNPVGLVNDIGSVFKRTFKKKPDKSNRVPIPLDDPQPDTRSRILP